MICSGVRLRLILSSFFKGSNKPDSLNQNGPLFPRQVNVKEVAQKLGVRYVVEGSVRKVGNRVRIVAQLIDGISGKHIWAERYERDLEDVFALQDEITETNVARIEPEIGTIESRRAKQKPPQNLDAWDYYHLGLAHLYKFTKDDYVVKKQFFKSQYIFVRKVCTYVSQGCTFSGFSVQRK